MTVVCMLLWAITFKMGYILENRVHSPQMFFISVNENPLTR